MLFLELFGYLLLILVAAEVFVNALEHLGEKLKISEGVTGSLFAAVGTAMPETLVPPPTRKSASAPFWARR